MNWLPNVFPNALRGVARPCLVDTTWFGQDLTVCMVPPFLIRRFGKNIHVDAYSGSGKIRYEK